MSGLFAIDTALFRFVNQSLANPAFDWLMPVLAGGRWFVLLLVPVVLAWILWGGRRARLCALLLVLVVPLGDGLICNPLKHSIGRPRPYSELPETRLLVGPGANRSMPSGHAMNCFAAATVLFLFYRRSWRFSLPIAAAVAFSRVYNGVHYPSDVTAGAALGIGWALGAVWLLDIGWRRLARPAFPRWLYGLPSLRDPDARGEPPAETDPGLASRETHWLRLGYLLIAAALVFRLGYLASGKVELSEDEAYQWVWSKHPALSYYSKPPIIAYAQWFGTHLWGDTAFGVRFVSPLSAAILGIFLLRFLARERNPPTAVAFVALCLTTPLLIVGSILLTVDAPLVLFWTAALVAAWRALQPDAPTRYWIWTGLWVGLAFLSKYTGMLFWICLALFFALWKPARAHLRRPGPWLALLIALLCTAPVLIWNLQHGWITVAHLAENAQMERGWQLNPRHFFEFLGGTVGLLHPIYFGAAIWAGIAFWRRLRGQPLPLYLFCLGAPVYLGYLAYTLHSRVHPNWIAVAALPLLLLMLLYWEHRWQNGARVVIRWFWSGIVLGVFVTAFALWPELVPKLTGRQWPPKAYPLRRIQGWAETAQAVEAQRQKLEAEGQPAFIVCDHYGLTGELSFYIPAARQQVRTNPFVYYKTTRQPENQFYFWPGYHDTRHGQNAIFVVETDTPKPPPPEIAAEFQSLTDLGIFPIAHRGLVLRHLQLWACRGLKPPEPAAAPSFRAPARAGAGNRQ